MYLEMNLCILSVIMCLFICAMSGCNSVKKTSDDIEGFSPVQQEYIHKCLSEYETVLRLIEQSILDTNKLPHIYASVAGMKCEVLQREVISNFFSLLQETEQNNSTVSKLCEYDKKITLDLLSDLFLLAEEANFRVCNHKDFYAASSRLSFLMANYEQAFEFVEKDPDYEAALGVLDGFERTLKKKYNVDSPELELELQVLALKQMSEHTNRIAELKEKIKKKPDYDLNRRRSVLKRSLNTALLGVTKAGRVGDLKKIKKEYEILGDSAAVSWLQDRLQYELQPEESSRETMEKVICNGDFSRWSWNKSHALVSEQ